MISTIYEPSSPADELGRTTELPGAGPQQGDPSGVRSPGRLSELLKGAGASAGVQLTDRVFGLYKFKVDQTVENRTYLHDEVQVVARMKGNLYLKFSSELDARSNLGQPPNRQALLEQRWFFGLPSGKTKKTSPERNEEPTP